MLQSMRWSMTSMPPDTGTSVCMMGALPVKVLGSVGLGLSVVKSVTLLNDTNSMSAALPGGSTSMAPSQLVTVIVVGNLRTLPSGTMERIRTSPDSPISSWLGLLPMPPAVVSSTFLPAAQRPDLYVVTVLEVESYLPSHVRSTRSPPVSGPALGCVSPKLQRWSP